MNSGKRVAHRFGGVWTEIKLRALNEYLDFYQKALKNKEFETWYIDAFAGTGDRHAEMQQGGLLENSPIEHVERILDGSARKALKIDPPFSHYWFAEQHGGRAGTLKELMAECSYDIIVKRGEANSELAALFSSPPWTDHPNSRRQRGVVFLDPYGMSVHWSTLKMLADTKRVDVWYLFPRKAVVQQLAHKIGSIDEGKRRRLAQIFGSDSWLDEFYPQKPQPTQWSLWEEAVTPSSRRIASGDQISAYARKQLGRLFCYVSEPLPLIVNGSDFFELYCLSNNGPAIPLIKKGVEHVIAKYTPASRRKSAL